MGQPYVVPAVPARKDGDVTVVLVSYWTGPVLDEAIARVLAADGVQALVVVDNGNPPEITARLAADTRLTLLTGHGNVGFAAGCRLGVAATDSPRILLLNPDGLLEPDTLPRLDAALAGLTRGLWVATPRLLEADGREQAGARRNRASPLACLAEALHLAGRFGLPRLNLNREPLPPGPVTVPAISGAFMLMERATWDALDGLDPGYFLHVEDLDFCARLEDAGGTAWFVPDVTLTHVKSTSQAPRWAVERAKLDGFRRYFARHFPTAPSQLVLALLTAGLWLRIKLQTN